MNSSINQLTTIIANMPLSYLKEIEPASSNLYFYLVLKFEDEIFDDRQELRLRNYLIGFVRAAGGSVKAVNFSQNRVHLLVGLSQFHALGTFVRELKLITKTFARRQLGAENFDWQAEYEAFTVSFSQIERVRSYVRRQNWLETEESYASSWQRVSPSKLY